MPKALLYALIFAVGFITVSVWGFWITVRPPRISIPGTPQLYRLPAEDVAIGTVDGLKLAAWFIPRRGSGQVPPAGGAPAVILLHGYPAEKADMLSLAQALQPSFATLLVDMRYFGKSEGRFTTLGLRERDDLKRAVSFLRERGFGRIGVFGFSLGGAIGITTAAEDSRIGAVSAYAPFVDLRQLGYEAYARLWVLKYPLVELMRLWGLALLGGDVTRPSPAGAAGGLSIPVFIIASREDEQIPFSHAEQLSSALGANPRAEFYFLERGRHGELPGDFNQRIAGFFIKHLLTLEYQGLE